MAIVFSTFAWYFPILGLLEYILINKKKRYANEKKSIGARLDYDISYNYRVSVSFSVLVFLPMILAAGLREGISDTALYIDIFKSYPNSVFDLPKFLARGDKGPGFIVFSVIIKQLFGGDYHIWLFIIAAIQGLCLALTYRKFTSEIVYCAFAFFASTAFMAWMTNGMRQFLVAAILFACFPLLQKRKLRYIIVFCCIWLIMIRFHTSSIIVFPLYLAALGKPFNKKTMLLLALCVVAIVFMDMFTDVLGGVLEGTEYAGVTDNLSVSNGQNPIRLLFSSVPVILAFVFRKQIPEDTPDIVAIAINMSLITFSLDLLSTFTSGIMFGRLSVYFCLFNYMLFPWEIKTFFPKNNRVIIYCIWVIAFLVFFFYQMHVWGHF